VILLIYYFGIAISGRFIMENPFLPKPVIIEDIIVETEDRNLKTFKLIFKNPGEERYFSYIPGQFAELSIPGKGEIPIGIASSPTETGFLSFTINKTGMVTNHIHLMKPGDLLGIRGPLGNGFPWDVMEGKTIVMVGGGFGFTTLRSSIKYILDSRNRSRFQGIHVVYGARTPGMLLYLDELIEWERRDDIYMQIVSQEAEKNWKYHVGLAPAIAEQTIPKGNDETIAIVCGPPAMIKYTQPVLDKLGYSHENVLLSLEMRMKCGIGICGRCNIGDRFVCKDGPVFSRAVLNNLPQEY
jgi:NAD(P)H-flavin reductase